MEQSSSCSCRSSFRITALHHSLSINKACWYTLTLIITCTLVLFTWAQTTRRQNVCFVVIFSSDLAVVWRADAEQDSRSLAECSASLHRYQFQVSKATLRSKQVQLFADVFLRRPLKERTEQSCRGLCNLFVSDVQKNETEGPWSRTGQSINLNKSSYNPI